jgi:DNA-3-methyladenine glycosylase II
VEIFRIEIPDEFSFKHSLALLRRSPKEVLHCVDADTVSKALVPRANGMGGKPVILQVEERDQQLQVKVMNGQVNAEDKKWISIYIREWFDLDTDLGPFYRMARKDELLAPLVRAYRGYHIVGQPDLFESLVWAVLGQQINLAFAYTLKSRFVKAFGQQVDWQDRPHYIFPLPAVVAEIRPEQLLALQFSRQKAAYTVNIANAFLAGDLSKEKLVGLSLEEAKTALCKIKGVGNWTANYALMKTFRYPDAFPLEDAGLHNAIKQQLNLKSKPSIDRVKKIFKKYRGWEAYATLYLWKSLK